MPAILSSTFPRVRNDRGEAAQPLSAPAQQTNIRTRVWPYYILCQGANSRTTIVSAPFTGPIMVYELKFRYGGGAASSGGLSLFWSTSEGGQLTNGPTSTKPGGTPIFDPASVISTAESDTDTIAEHIPNLNADPAVDQTPLMRPRYIIDKNDRIFLKLSGQSSTTGSQHYRGWVVVFEGGSVQDLINFS